MQEGKEFRLYFGYDTANRLQGTFVLEDGRQMQIESEDIVPLYRLGRSMARLKIAYLVLGPVMYALFAVLSIALIISFAYATAPAGVLLAVILCRELALKAAIKRSEKKVFEISMRYLQEAKSEANIKIEQEQPQDIIEHEDTDWTREFETGAKDWNGFRND